MLSQMLQSVQKICISTICSKGLADGQQGDNKGPLLSHLYLPVFSAGQLQCNLTSVHLEDFAKGQTHADDVRLTAAFCIYLL